MSLFRRDAIAQQQQKFYGTILLARSYSFTYLTLFFSAVAALIVGFFFLFGFTRKETVPGVLLPQNGLIRVYSAQAGILLERKVKDGQAVKAGDVLFVLSGERSSSLKGDTQVAIGQSLASRIDKLQNELGEQRTQARLQQAALERRRAQLQGQVEQIGTEIALQQKRFQLAEVAAQRYADLRKSNFVSDAQVQDKAAEVLDQQTRLRTLERSRASLRMDLTVVDAELQDQPLKAKREASALERGIAEIEQGVAQNEAEREIVVRAPKSGVVTGIAGEPGQRINAELALASIIPADGKLEAELYAPTRSIGFIRPGTKVQMRYQAFPYQKFGQYTGTVSEVSSTALQPVEIGLPFARDPSSTDPLYRIRVSLDSNTVRAYGRAEPLKSGMQLDATVVLEYRKLYEWVVEPLLSVTGKI